MSIDIPSIEAALDQLVGKKPLGVSSKPNMQNNTKSLTLYEAAASVVRAIASAHASASTTTSTSSKSTPSLLTSSTTTSLPSKQTTHITPQLALKAFFCTYQGSPDNIRVHQAYIVTLLSQKLYRDALVHLRLMADALNEQVHGTRIVWRDANTSPSTDLLSAVAPASVSPKLTLLVLAFYLLAFQSWLQYLTANLKTVLKNSDPYLNCTCFLDMAQHLLSLSSATAWVAGNRNMLKIVSGFLKITSYGSGKLLQNLTLLLASAAFQCKLAQLDASTAIKDILVNDSTLPFLLELKNDPNTSSLTNSTIEALLQSYPVLNSGGKALNAFRGLSDQSIRSLSSLQPDPAVFKDTDFLTLLQTQTSSFTKGPSASIYLASCLDFMAKSVVFLESLPTEVITVLDSMSATLKKLVSETHDGELQLPIDHLYRIYAKFDDFKGIRNMANLMFNLGKHCQRFDVWKKCLSFELHIHSKVPSKESVRCFQEKLERIVNFLYASNSFEEGTNLAVIYFSEVLPMREDSFFENLETYQPPTIIHLLCKNIAKDNCVSIYFGPESCLNDATKAALFVSMLKYLVKVNLDDKAAVLKTFASALSIASPVLKLVCAYHYLTAACVDFIDMNITKDNPLLYSGILVKKAETDDEALAQAIGAFGEWMEVRSPDLHSYETEVLHSLIGLLHYKEKHGECINLIQRYSSYEQKEGPETLKLQLALQMAECELWLKLWSPEKVESLLQASSNTLKSLSQYFDASGKLKFISTQTIGFWKVLQLDYYILCNDIKQAQERFESVRQLMQKPEFDFNSKSSASVSQKFGNLILLAKFNMIANRLNCAFGSYTTAFQNSKMAIKLLFSSVRKLPSNMHFAEHNEIRWSATRLLQESYQGMIMVCRNVGSSKRHHYFVCEMEKVCDNYGKYFVAKENVLRGSEVTVDSSTDDKLGQRIQALVNGSSEPIDFIDESVFLDIDHIFALKGATPQHIVQYSADGRYENAIKKLLMIKLDMQQVNTGSHAMILPSISRSGRVQENTNRLMDIKNTILNLLSSDSFQHLHMHQVHELGRMLETCLFALGKLAILKDQSLLHTLGYLKDISRHAPLQNEIAISESSDTFVPPKLGKTLPRYSANLASEFGRKSEQIPSSWTVVTLDICAQSNTLSIQRISHGKEHFLQIPLIRNENGIAFDKIRNQFRQIIEQSDKSVKRTTTSQIKTKDGRKQWWKLRFELDLQLKALLESVEYNWLGGFKGIFGSAADLDLQQKLNAAWTRFSGEPVILDELVAGLFAALPNDFNEINEDELNDLVNFVIQDLTAHRGTEITQDTTWLKQRLQEIVCGAKNTNNEHVVLIPGPECTFFPWECLSALQGRSVSRMPSVQSLVEVCSRRTSETTTNPRVFYLLNPGGDLVRTQQRFEPVFRRFTGICGRKPSETEFLRGLANTDVFVYLGHGGSEYARSSQLVLQQAPPSLLIGCSSGHIEKHGFLSPSGNVLNWLSAKCPMAMANLWDVTDKDIDAFSESVFDKWGLLGSGDMSICSAVAESREKCTLRYLNGSAPVVYGLPLKFKETST